MHTSPERLFLLKMAYSGKRGGGNISYRSDGAVYMAPQPPPTVVEIFVSDRAILARAATFWLVSAQSRARIALRKTDPPLSPSSGAPTGVLSH